jgi:CPA2 family monovalent cation:H+ antiporter-2
MHQSDSLLLTLVVVFVLAFVLGMLALRVKLSPLVGYLVAGVAIGPFTPGLTANGGMATQLAEVGVILLMFGVGLHISPKDLLKVRGVAVPGALLQVGLGAALGWALGGALGLPASEGLVLGLCLGVASTVVVMRSLEERRELKSDTGRTAVGWLVVQDIIAVLALVLLPMASSGHKLGTWASAGEIGGRMAMIALFVALMFAVGGRVLPWLLVRMAHTRSRELFTLGVLAIALGIAWLAYAVFGASFALGAFVAGLVLNASPLGHNAAERSLPLRDAFAVLFFVSVGMLFDPKVLLSAPLALVGVLAVVLVAGIGAVGAVAVMTRMRRAQTARLAAALPQIGEFSFVLAGLAVTLGAMTPATHSLIVGAAILSITVNPVLLWAADRFGGAREGRAPGASGPGAPALS